MRDAIAIEDLTKRYGDRAAVEGLTLGVARGEIVAVLGRNGAGKTTTVECAVGLRRPDAGTVRILGEDPVRDRAAVVEHLGVMLQEGGAYQAATPREMLQLYAALYADALPVDEALALVELEGPANRRYRTLSGGEKQRVSLALALVGRPRVVFLDEPTAGMDPAARRRTWGTIGALRDDGVAVLLTTHFMEEAEQLADRVAIIDAGRLLACATPASLTAGEGRIVVTSSPGVDVDALAAAVGAHAERRDAKEFVVHAPAERVAAVTAWLDAHGHPVLGVTTRGRSLEDVFLELTGGST